MLENGSYPFAKNKDGKCPFDGVIDTKLCHSIPEHVIASCKELMTKYDCSLTLRYLAATKIIESEIPYRHLLPEDLVKFVDLH